MKTVTLILPAMLLVAGVALAETPLAGTWKFDAAKSKLTGETMKFASAGNGEMRLTAGAESYTFKDDGSDSATPFGETAIWTKQGDGSWQEVVKKGSMTLETDEYKISDGGKTLTVTSTGTKPNGESFNDTEVFQRMAGTTGLLGTWKSNKVEESSRTGYVIKDNGDGTITWELPDYKATVHLKIGGPAETATGPTVPEGLTLSMTKEGPRRFVVVEKLKDKPIWRGVMTVSADGHTLTEVGSAPGKNEPVTSVYEKE